MNPLFLTFLSICILSPAGVRFRLPAALWRFGLYLLDQLNSRFSLLCIVVSALLMGGVTLAYPRTLLDSPTSTYVGKTILEGGVPYRDALEPRAPGVFFAYALQIFLLGESAVALRTFDLLWQLATALALASIAAHLCNRPTAGLIAGVAYLLAYFTEHYSSWAQPDTFLSLPLALAFLFSIRGVRRDSLSDWLVAGLMVGIATLFKPPYGLFGVLPLLLILSQLRGAARRAGLKLFVLAIGFAVPLAATALYFLWKNGFEDLLSAQFVLAPAYLSRIHEMLGLPAFINSLLRPVLIPFFFMTAVGFVSLAVRLHTEKPHWIENMAVAWFAIAGATFILHGSYLRYHYLAMAAPAAILFASSLARMLDSPAQWRRPFANLLIALMLIVPAAKWQHNARFAWQVWRGFAPDAPWRELGKYIKAHTNLDDTIFVWGNAPLVYLLAERKAASRFLCTAYISVDAPTLNYREIALRELHQRRPTYFVLVKEGSITPALPDSQTSLAEFPALRAWVGSGYQVEIENHLYALFRRKAPESSVPAKRLPAHGADRTN